MKRLLSGLFLASILISVLQTRNSLLFLLFINIFLVLGIYEFFRMLEKKEKLCLKKTGVAAGCLLTVSFFLEIHFIIFSVGLGCLCTVLFLKRCATVALLQKIFYTTAGILYVSWLGSHSLLLWNFPDGHHFIYLVIFIVSFSDIGALYVGKFFGKHPLTPKISPNKTIEGSIGGIAGSIAGAFFTRWLFFSHMGIGSCIALGILGSIFAQAGDLFESAIKRSLNQKDSGGLIPGHGGVLDRIDSLLAVMPLIYYLKYFNLLSF